MTASQLKLGTNTTDSVKILGTCIIYLVHLDSKKLKEVIFYIASNEGSILLSCNTSLTLGLTDPKPRLNYLSPRASLITSSADHPRKTKAQFQIQKQEITVQTTNQQQDAQVTITTVSKLVTSQEQIMHEYPDIFDEIGKFPGPPYHIQVDPTVTPKQTLADLYQFILKKLFKKILQSGIKIPLTEAMPWINRFVLVESKDKQGQLKLRICLDPTNLNKAMTRELYHFCTLEDISHMLADTCIFTVCD